MKRSIQVLAAVLAAALVLAGCSSATSSTSTTTTTTVAVKAIKATESSISVLPGKTAQINVTFTPTNATNKNITYTLPTGTTAITVSSTGLVTASSTATLGTSVKVSMRSADGSKADSVTVKIEKAVAASTVTKTTPVAATPVTTTAANGKVVPKSAAVGTTKKKTVASSTIGSGTPSFQAIAKSAGNLGKTAAVRSASGSVSLYGEVFSPVATFVVDINTNAAALVELGMAPVDATLDITASAADTGATKTVTNISSAVATAFSTTATPLAAGDSVTLNNWKFHTLDQFESDGTTENPYYAEGYTQEIYFEYGGSDYWLDFNDDSTLVLIEVSIPSGTTTTSMIVTGDFNNLIQTFSFSQGNLAYSFDAYFDSDNAAANGAWASMAFDAWDETTSTGATANIDGYVDDAGAFIIGFLQTDPTVEAATAYLEGLTTNAAGAYAQDYLAVVPVSEEGALGSVTTVSGTFAENTYSKKLYTAGTFVAAAN